MLKEQLQLLIITSIRAFTILIVVITIIIIAIALIPFIITLLSKGSFQLVLVMRSFLDILQLNSYECNEYYKMEY